MPVRMVITWGTITFGIGVDDAIPSPARSPSEEGGIMSTELASVIRSAIRGWPETLRLCLIIVVAAALIVCIHLVGPDLPFLMR